MGFWRALVLAGVCAAATDLAAGGTDLAARASSDPYPDYSKLASCPGYKASSVSTTSSSLKANLVLAGKACNVYGTDLTHLTLSVSYETDNRIHVKIEDQDTQVYQVPESVFPRPGGQSSSASNKLTFSYTTSPFAFKITRRNTGEVLFDTSASPLIFETQYLHLRTKLPPNPNLFGLGEHSDPFRLKTSNYIRTFWNRDSGAIPADTNLYGTHPFYLEHRTTGSHGVFLLNSNGMDVMISQDAKNQQYLEYNTIGGVFDFYFFAGDTPTAVSQQYTEVAGRPVMQPYWGLGFHQCRYGYRDVYEVAEVVANYSAASIPLETQWNDIDYMDGRKTFSLDPQRYPLSKVRELVNYLHSHNQHYVMMVDPAVAYQKYPPLQEGIKENVFLLRSNGSAWLGVVWPGVTVFPDWFSKNVQSWWNGLFNNFFNKNTGVDIDALWIDMNEPSNFPCNFPCDNPYAAAKGFPPTPPPVRSPPRPIHGFPCDFQPGGCSSKREVPEISAEPEVIPDSVEFDSLRYETRATGSKAGLSGRNLLYPKYSIHNHEAYMPSWNADKGGLSNRTVNTNVLHQNGLAMYDTHNLYGTMMSSASRDAMLSRRPGLRPMIITRSTFAGAGSKVGHWLGDNVSSWSQYRASIRTMLAFTSLYGFNMVGSDTCGFIGDTTEELCARWASLGAFNAFYRNHNDAGSIPQEFYRWPTVAASARNAIYIRYRMLDYIYTAFYQASVSGTPAITPMLHQYPKDPNAWALELQYFYGPGVMVAPVTEQGATSVSVYFPKDVFYDWYKGKRIAGTGSAITVKNQDVTTIPIYLKSGVIIPTRQHSASTTADLRKQPIELVVPLRDDGTAEGYLYVDDGVSINQKAITYIKFEWNRGELRVSGNFGYKLGVKLGKITVFGEYRGKNEPAGDRVRSKDVDISLEGPTKTKVY